MAEYTNAQRLLIGHWRDQGVKWGDIQRRYNELFNDNRSLCGLRKVAKRNRTTIYSVDSPPLKRQKPSSSVKESSKQKDKVPEPISGKEQEPHPHGQGVDTSARLKLQLEIMVTLGERASRSCSDMIADIEQRKLKRAGIP